MLSNISLILKDINYMLDFSTDSWNILEQSITMKLLKSLSKPKYSRVKYPTDFSVVSI
jgi:hypothetical protein